MLPLSFYSFGQVVLEKIFRIWPIRNKNCLWWPCLLTVRDVMSNLYKGPSIDASYKISVHLAEEKIKMWKVNGRQTPNDCKNSHCLWQNELTRHTISEDIFLSMETDIKIQQNKHRQNNKKTISNSLISTSFKHQLLFEKL